MKKSFITIALIACALVSANAQSKSKKSKTDKPVTRLETAANFKENKTREYKIEDNDLLAFAQCASYGYDTWIKTTSLPANQIDQYKQMFIGKLQGLLNQQAEHIKADTSKKAKADTTKKVQ